jgi:hypothetical protein
LGGALTFLIVGYVARVQEWQGSGNWALRYGVLKEEVKMDALSRMKYSNPGEE